MIMALVFKKIGNLFAENWSQSPKIGNFSAKNWSQSPKIVIITLTPPKSSTGRTVFQEFPGNVETTSAQVNVLQHRFAVDAILFFNFVVHARPSPQWRSLTPAQRPLGRQKSVCH
jgi:hypothetical protein